MAEYIQSLNVIYVLIGLVILACPLSFLSIKIIDWSFVVEELGFSGLVKQWFCKHDWTDYGYTTVKCNKCFKVKKDAKLSSELRNKFILEMVEAGHWDRDEAINGLAKRGLPTKGI